ncbi:saccharopine dehydrogenase family protein [Gloeobacter kilaueensis]|uniref:Saccharopine dehydrogenase n=1 Tax=Gloeobacter kilaueensis (strain ATCC BAA-2537 / CCAP 1431/1 / ULC 316 / JS1) TaxID=1183438 RepID=U5QJL3_GLOK1|nr:saccharopine dehydrogenase NADP-binding domain-containing protein [Gloeobacter kilaueensis]AGY59078.1 saccharopine dehydrogenase [Gloeobacter kilaueensis JS1]
MTTRQNFLLYGANGYTGGLIARKATEGGLRPVLAGRSQAVARLGAELGLEYRIFNLEDRAALDRALEEVVAVLHCAGPFVRTSGLMVAACLRTGTHYLDITGEVAVFEAAMARHEQAQRAGVMLMPGVGCDVVPTDCLAAYLAAQLPEADSLVLALQILNVVSRGTALTIVEGPYEGGLVRRDGILTPVPAGYKTRSFDFGAGAEEATTIPWGDLNTAFWQTGIPNIEAYLVLPPAARFLLFAGQWLGGVLRSEPVRNLQKQFIASGPPGPTEAERRAGVCRFWGEVTKEGRSVQARLRTVEGYTLTALTALLIAQKVLSGQFQPGFRTPAQVYGADLILEVEGSLREDL